MYLGRIRKLFWTVTLASLLAAPLGCIFEDGPIEVRVPMRDDVELAADLYLPTGAGTGPFPTILVLTPYGKAAYVLDSFETDEYAVLVADWRGTGASAGQGGDDQTLGEDGYDLVEWIADQEWSNGRVGMWGSSALAHAQWLTAAEQPPHLRAIMPAVRSFHATYEEYYPGGVKREAYIQSLAFLGYFSAAGLVSANPRYNAIWAAQEVETDISNRIQVPALVVGGWYDSSIDTMFSAFEKVRAKSAPWVRGEHRMLVGPWVHQSLDEDFAGALEYPSAAGRMQEAATAFFDRHVRGLDVPARPMVEWYEMGEDSWKQAASWPPPAEERSFYMHGSGELLESAPELDDDSTLYTYDPLDPSPTIGGPGLPVKGPNGPLDQTPIEARVATTNDNIVFSTPVLDEPLVVEGRIRVKLFVSSSAVDTDFMVRVTDVYPDGRSMYVTDTAVRGRFRDGVTEEHLMVPGEIYEIELELPSTALSFQAGHQLRVIVSSSNNDRFFANRNKDTFVLNDPFASGEVAENVLYHDAQHPSRVILPLAG